MKYLWFINEQSPTMEGEVSYINIKLPRGDKGRASREMFFFLPGAFKIKASIKFPLMVMKPLLI